MKNDISNVNEMFMKNRTKSQCDQVRNERIEDYNKHLMLKDDRGPATFLIGHVTWMEEELMPHHS